MTDPDTCPCGRTIAATYDGEPDDPERCVVCAARELAREIEPERFSVDEQDTLDV